MVAVSNGAETRGMAMALVAESSSVAASVIRPDLTVVTGSAPFVGGAAVVTGVEILPASIMLSLSAGGTVKLRANAHLSDGTVEEVSTQVGWSLQSSGIAEVTASGELTALKTGATTCSGEALRGRGFGRSRRQPLRDSRSRGRGL